MDAQGGGGARGVISHAITAADGGKEGERQAGTHQDDDAAVLDERAAEREELLLARAVVRA